MTGLKFRDKFKECRECGNPFLTISDRYTCKPCLNNKSDLFIVLEKK